MKYQSMTQKEMSEINGGKQLSYIECVKQASGELVETIRHYDHKFLGIRWKSTGKDKDGDFCNCDPEYCD
jgi:hypothetical protein